MMQILVQESGFLGSVPDSGRGVGSGGIKWGSWESELLGSLCSSGQGMLSSELESHGSGRGLESCGLEQGGGAGSEDSLVLALALER